MKPKRDNWKLDKTSRHFILVTLTENQNKILAFRRRWHIDDDGLPDDNYFFPWRTEIEEECQNMRCEIRVSELEAYFEAPNEILARPILSSDLEGRLREEKRGDSLEVVFKAEIRTLGSQLELPAEWDLIIDHYVTYNVFNFDLVFNHGITTSIRYKASEDSGLIGENICLILGQNTGSEDLDNFWAREIKPLLKNLIERVKDKKRYGSAADIREKMATFGALGKNWQTSWNDPETSKLLKERDRDIVLATMSDKKADQMYSHASEKKTKKLNMILGKRVQNIRQQSSEKNHPS